MQAQAKWSEGIAFRGKSGGTLMAWSATPSGRKQLWDLYRIESFVDATPADFEPVREAFSKVGLPVK